MRLALTALLALASLLLAGQSLAASGRAVSLQGTLEVRHGDNFKTGKDSYSYYLRTSGGKRLRLELPGSPIEHAEQRVTLRGHRQGNIVSVDSTSYAQQRTTARSGGPGQRRIAVFLINFQNDSAEPFGASTGYDNISSINDYYSEESSGELTFTGDVALADQPSPWITLPYSNSVCSISTWAADARAAAESRGFETDGYDQYLFIFRTQFPSSCWFAGFAQLGGQYAWVNDFVAQSVPSTVIHELGHNLDLFHSSSADCGVSNRIPITPSYTPADCFEDEYGDPFDVMGRSSYQNNAVQKKNLAIKQSVPGFFSGDILPVDSDGTYTLSPAEPGFSGNELLEIPTRPASPPHSGFQNYYIDFRQPYGLFDNFSPTSSLATGVVIRLAAIDTAHRSRLVDATPGDRGLDPVVNVGQTFIDFESDLAVRPLSTSPSGAEVEISRDLSGKVFLANSSIIYKARSGQANDVTIEHSGNDFTLTDRGTTSLEPGNGCVATVDPQAVSCTATGIDSSSIKLGDGDDVFSGADEADRVDAGLGNDTVSGGDGIDTVDYLERTRPVRVDLDGRIGDDGQPGERDTIAADVENVIGGEGKDKLTGDDGPNVLDGWGGHDRIFGRGGNDVIRGDSGHNTIDGGDGDDTFTSVLTGRDYLKGGDGSDTFRTWDRDSSDRIYCGEGISDHVTADANDRLQKPTSCEDIDLF